LLGQLLGKKILTPPATGLRAPRELRDFALRRPKELADGRPFRTSLAPISIIEHFDAARLSHDRRAPPHWDGEQWHDGPAHGVLLAGQWAPFFRASSGVWALGSAPVTEMLRHGDAWWLKRDGRWFVLHEGQPWAWRHFQDWDADGFFQPGSGTEMVYSHDYGRVAVITPGQGALVFDAISGLELAQINEAEMPSRFRPHPNAHSPTP
jgi:hypothetical protein